VNPDKPTFRQRAIELFARGFCVACAVKSMQANGYPSIEPDLVHQVARITPGAFRGHCIRCQADRASQ